MHVVLDSTHGPEHRASLCTRRLAHGLAGRLKQPSGVDVEDETALAVAATLLCRALVAPANERNPRHDTPAGARDRNAKVPYAAVGTRSGMA